MDDNVIYGVDFKGNSLTTAFPDVPVELLILPVIYVERQNTEPCEYCAPSDDCA
jgi:hypothetical protein